MSDKRKSSEIRDALEAWEKIKAEIDEVRAQHYNATPEERNRWTRMRLRILYNEHEKARDAYFAAVAAEN